jgi:Ni2+-binding GTPase involved in maturation of urease and hydrogenase
MKLVTVAGPPACGKTSIILHVLKHLSDEGISAGVVKFDCLTADEQARYQSSGILSVVGLSAGQCPDHFYISNINDAVAWAKRKNIGMLVSESAGLCNRCSPHIKGILAVCILDHLSGINTPRKIGPMLRMADMVVLSKGDIVSQAEREVFAMQCEIVNPRAEVVSANGITGQGTLQIAEFFKEAPDIDTLEEYGLRFTMPSALCSYCLGGKLIGDSHQMGNLRKMSFDDD